MTLEEVKIYASKITKLSVYEPTVKFKELFDEMAVHTRKRKPENLLLKRRPNEPEDVFQYRINNYEPITYGSMNKAFDSLHRMLTGINAQLHITNEVVKKYMDTKKFMRNTFDQFFTKIFLKRMIEDPNGFILWLPEKVKNSSEAIKPIPKLMLSYSIIDWGDDFIVCLSDEKTYISGGQNDPIKKIGKVYYILTEDWFYRYQEIDGGRFELIPVYEHKLGEIPMVPLGGDYNSDGFFESFFTPYVAFGNEAIRQFSDFQSLSTTAAHPIREVFMMPCEVTTVGKSKSRKAYKSNEFSGENNDVNLSYSRVVEVKPFTTGPHNEIQRKISDEGTGSNPVGSPYLPAAIPSVRFINQDIKYVENAKATTFDFLAKGEDALNMNLAKGDLSGYAKELDLLNHEDMINKIANQFYDAKQTSARFIVAYMTNTSYDKAIVKLVKPASFRVKTESELVLELDTLKKAGAPAMLVSAVACQLADLRFSGDEVNRKIFQTVAIYDPLFVYTLSEKQTMVISGTASKDNVTKSIYIYSLLLNILDDKKEAVFIETKPKDLFNQFEVLVKPYLIPETVLTDKNGNPIP